MKLPNRFKLTDSDDTQKLPPLNPTRPLPPLSETDLIMGEINERMADWNADLADMTRVFTEPAKARITVNEAARTAVLCCSGFLSAKPRYQRFSRFAAPDRFDENLLGWLNGVEVWLEEQVQP